MSELRRAAYLDAIGIDRYLSRQQLPGAAVTMRLEVVAPPPPVIEVPQLPDVTAPASRGRPVAAVEPVEQLKPHTAEPVPQFSLSAIVAGRWLWVEELAGMPLTSAQVQLVHAMARALLVQQAQSQGNGTAAISELAQPDVEQFHWPIHNNHQLDLNATAARAGVAAFVSRRMEKHECRGLVLLGDLCAHWVAIAELNIQTVCTASTAELLVNPSRKQTVWRDLLPLVAVT